MEVLATGSGVHASRGSGEEIGDRQGRDAPPFLLRRAHPPRGVCTCIHVCVLLCRCVYFAVYVCAPVYVLPMCTRMYL